MPIPPRNPYIAGKALGDARGFFGREDVFRVVETVLSSPDQNSVVLFGQRRIGKTSILLNLRSRLSASSFVPVYFDLMDRARKSLAQVSFELAATIAQELRLPQPVRTDFDDEGRGFRDKFLQTVYTALGNNRLVLLFDEFDVLNVGAEEKLASTSAAFAFFPYLRDLMMNEPRLGFVFVLGRKMEELGTEFKPTFKASRFYRVSVLDDESARTLVRTAEHNHLLHFSDDAVTRVLDFSARHPYFTQLTCQLLFELAYSNEPPRVQLTSADVDAIVPKVLEAGENIFDWIWDGLPPAERVIFSAIASGTDEQTIITEDRLISILQTQGIRILIRELELAPKTLVEWEMLRQSDGGYKFFVELLRRWVVKNKPLAKVKEELDRVQPIAERMFRTGSDLYGLGEDAEAIVQLRGALTRNPNHLKARLLLGEIFRTQGKFDDAVQELEEAYRIDEDSTRRSLETALAQRAGMAEKENHTDAALEDYERIIAISPNNKTAQEERIAIWSSRGEFAFKANDFETARSAFQKAGATEKIVVIDMLERKREFEKLALSANDSIQRELWEQAITTYQRLCELDSEEPRWREGLEKAKAEWNIARRYAEGIGAMEQNKWDEAQRAFADVIYARSDYKDASENLSLAKHQRKAPQDVLRNSSTESDMTPGAYLNNRYQIYQQLDQGGINSVYRALHTSLNRWVAITVQISPRNITPQERERSHVQFRRQAEILAHLCHQNLPRVIDYFMLNGNDYLVMEFIEGQNLEQNLQAHGFAREDTVHEWANQLLDTLMYLHSQTPPVIHRDVKPRNIILKPDGKIVLVDFGLAKLLIQSTRTATSIHGMGTPGYAPIEQYSSNTDARSDIYSLGATLYHLLTGIVPTDAPSRITDPNAMPALRMINPKISAHTEGVVLRALAINPQDRFQSASEMRHVLNDLSVSDTTASIIPDTSIQKTSSKQNPFTLAVNSILRRNG